MHRCTAVLTTPSLCFDMAQNNIRELSSSVPRFLWTSSPENNAAMSYCAAKLFIPQPSVGHRLRAPHCQKRALAGEQLPTVSLRCRTNPGTDVRMVNADLRSFIAPFHRLRVLMSLSRLDPHPLPC